MKDSDEYYNNLSDEEMQQILGRPPLKLFYKFNDYNYKTYSKERILSGIKELDYMLKGFELGCITLWSGATNCGKTSMLTLITRETIKQGNKVFFFNGEQTKDDFKNNLYKASIDSINDLIRVPYYKDNNIVDWYVKEKKVKELDNLYGNNLMIYNNDISRDIDTLLLAMTQANEQNGVKCFILDNFMQIDIETDNIYQEQSKIMEKLRTFAVNKNVHIHLVAHPRKIENFQVRLSLYDVAGSMNIPNKAYNIISIIRTSNIVKDSIEYKKLRLDLAKYGYDILKCDGILEILKTKGNENGLVGLIFDKDKRTYRIADILVGQEKEKLIRTIELENSIKAKKNNMPF